jgi:hypothetical protein
VEQEVGVVVHNWDLWALLTSVTRSILLGDL